MHIKIDTYTITDHTEETHCHNCGVILWEGDKAYIARGSDQPCCCPFCVITLAEQQVMSDIWHILDHKKG